MARTSVERLNHTCALSRCPGDETAHTKVARTRANRGTGERRVRRFLDQRRKPLGRVATQEREHDLCLSGRTGGGRTQVPTARIAADQSVGVRASVRSIAIRRTRPDVLSRHRPSGTGPQALGQSRDDRHQTWNSGRSVERSVGAEASTMAGKAPQCSHHLFLAF
jgi:hypothetical protein